MQCLPPRLVRDARWITITSSRNAAQMTRVDFTARVLLCCIVLCCVSLVEHTNATNETLLKRNIVKTHLVQTHGIFTPRPAAGDYWIVATLE
jgi:hypothetical protein